jgi:hypothetical protein
MLETGDLNDPFAPVNSTERAPEDCDKVQFAVAEKPSAEDEKSHVKSPSLTVFAT